MKNKTTIDDFIKKGLSPDEMMEEMVLFCLVRDVLDVYSDWKNGKQEKFELVPCKDIGKELNIEFKRN